LRHYDATTHATFIPADSNRARFLALLVANRIAPDTHRDQACRDALRPPWWLVPPQRNVGAKPSPRGCLHSLWLSPRRCQSLSGSRLGRFSNLHSIRWRKGGVQITRGGCTPVRYLGSPPLAKPLPETSTHIEGFLFAQHVIARSRQLVRQSLGRQDAVGLALLAFIEGLGLRAVAPREVRRLYEGPGQVLVAVLGIALTFLTCRCSRVGYPRTGSTS
jgi:hypothetical protein